MGGNIQDRPVVGRVDVVGSRLESGRGVPVPLRGESRGMGTTGFPLPEAGAEIKKDKGLSAFKTNSSKLKNRNVAAYKRYWPNHPSASGPPTMKRVTGFCPLIMW